MLFHGFVLSNCRCCICYCRLPESCSARRESVRLCFLHCAKVVWRCSTQTKPNRAVWSVHLLTLFSDTMLFRLSTCRVKEWAVIYCTCLFRKNKVERELQESNFLQMIKKEISSARSEIEGNTETTFAQIFQELENLCSTWTPLQQSYRDNVST